MSVLNENTIIGASAAGGDYEIEQSLRFDDGRGSYLSWTPASAGNRKTWTWSGWVKRGNLGFVQSLFSTTRDGSALADITFRADDKIDFMDYVSGYRYRLITTQLFRDVSSWYHLVAVSDTSNSNSSNRVSLYVNGERITAFDTATYPTLNLDGDFNDSNEHRIAREARYSSYLDGYLAEVNFIDGQALTPDSFGETGDYGEWKPIKYAGTYGTNGFYLPFEQDYAVEGFSTVVYEGTGAAQYVGGTGFSPSLVWMKNRSASQSHALVDVVRGRSKVLFSDSTSAEQTSATVNDDLVSFDTDGFTVGPPERAGSTNNNGSDIVAWNWDMGGTTASNTSGSITSSVRANTTYGQSIVSYSANGSTGTIGHGLGAVPNMIIVKKRNAVERFCVFHTATSNAYLYLNDTFSQQTGNADDRFGNNTSVVQPTSSVFTVGQANDVNGSSGTYIAYCFSSVTGYSSFGSYSGNGSSTGPVVTLGFSPAFVMIKRTDAAEQWRIFDNTRSPTNPVTRTLNANESNAESDNANNTLNFTSTGFQLTATNGGTNASGGTYIYAAFADTREYAYWYDQSGNNNDWTSEGGLTESDVMVDSPTNNFCTLNSVHKDAGITLSEGNLKAAAAAGSTGGNGAATFSINSGKWYWEFCLNDAYSGIYWGLHGVNEDISTNVYSAGAGVYVVNGIAGGLFSNGTKVTNITSGWANGDVVGLRYDADNLTLGVYRNNSQLGSNLTVPNALNLPVFYQNASSSDPSSVVYNFGSDSSFAGAKTPQGYQDANSVGDFFYPVPSGFLSLCTKSLPSVDVIPSENFNTVIYSGTGADNRVLSGVGFTPNLGIFKRRNGSSPTQFFDTLRGASQQLRSDTTSAESTQANKQKTFTSDGYTLGTDAQINGSGGTYVAWNWKAGGSASSNSNGTITSSVSANAAAGFSIVSYTGTGANATVGHGLSQKPNMTWIKPRNFSDNWIVTYDSVDGSDDQAYLNLTNSGGSPATQYAVAQNATTLGLTDWNNVNDANDTYIAYCFHSVDSYSRVGSYIGNGLADGPFVNLGFKAKFIMIKEVVVGSGNGEWQIFDTARNPINVANNLIAASTTGAESVGNTYQMLDILSNGFKLRSPALASQINMATTYIFLAFAENPFKHTNAR